MTLGIVLLQGPRRGVFLMSEVPLYLHRGSAVVVGEKGAVEKLIGVLLPNYQRQHRTLHIQKDVLPYALC